MVWVNDDGLRVKFGIDEAEKARVTEISGGDYKRTIEIVVDFDDLPAVADNSVIVDDSYVIPAGVQFTSVEILPSDTFVGSGATFNLGLTDHDGGSTILDVDALVTEATIAELNAGGVNITGWVGDIVTDGAAAAAVPLAESAYLTWEVNTAAITAGQAVIRVTFQLPKSNSGDTLVWTKP